MCTSVKARGPSMTARAARAVIVRPVPSEAVRAIHGALATVGSDGPSEGRASTAPDEGVTGGGGAGSAEVEPRAPGRQATRARYAATAATPVKGRMRARMAASLGCWNGQRGNVGVPDRRSVRTAGETFRSARDGCPEKPENRDTTRLGEPRIHHRILGERNEHCRALGATSTLLCRRELRALRLCLRALAGRRRRLRERRRPRLLPCRRVHRRLPGCDRRLLFLRRGVFLR